MADDTGFDTTEAEDQDEAGGHAYRRQNTRDPYKLMALSVIWQAVLDWRTKSSNGARHWLLKDAPDWLLACGIDVDLGYWEKWVNSGCPGQRSYWGRDRATDGDV